MLGQLRPGEEIFRCRCGKTLAARPGDRCSNPRCRRPLANVRVVQATLVTAGALHGPEHLQRLAPELGVRGRLVTDSKRVFGVVA